MVVVSLITVGYSLLSMSGEADIFSKIAEDCPSFSSGLRRCRVVELRAGRPGRPGRPGRLLLARGGCGCVRSAASRSASGRGGRPPAAGVRRPAGRPRGRRPRPGGGRILGRFPVGFGVLAGRSGGYSAGGRRNLSLSYLSLSYLSLSYFSLSYFSLRGHRSSRCPGRPVRRRRSARSEGARPQGGEVSPDDE